MKKKLIVPSEFYYALEHALNTFDYQEVFYLEYIALKMYEFLYPYIQKNSVILDVGCGYGLLTRLMQVLWDTRSMYGIDTDSQVLSYAQKKYSNVTFKQCTDVTIPFEDNFFDVVYIHSVLHHIPMQDHARFCTELHRVLKPGGIALIIELNPYNFFTYQEFKKNPQEQELEMLTPWYTKKLLKRHGKVSIYFFGFFQQWLSSLRFLENYIRKMPFGSLYAAILHTCKNVNR